MDRMGNIALGFNVSGATVFPSIHYVGRRPTDPPGTLPSGEMSLIDGGGALRDNKYVGDYSQMTIDPVDDCTFWYTGTYLPTTTAQDDWHTRIGSFRFTNCHGRDQGGVRRNKRSDCISAASRSARPLLPRGFIGDVAHRIRFIANSKSEPRQSLKVIEE